MKLEKALSNLKRIKLDDKWRNIQVKNIRSNPMLVKEGDIFICLKKGDEANKIIGEVKEKKPAFYIGEQSFGLENELVVKDARSAYALIAKALNENVCDRMRLIAVTGTNGKTTSTKIIADILKQAGEKVGTIGTLGARFENKVVDTGFTTPDPEDLHALLYLMHCKGIKTVVMEASAHAIELKKLDGMKFYASMITNVTQDHLDFFGDMENYYKAKAKLFDKNMTNLGVVCSADDFTKRLIQKPKCVTFSYGFNGDEDVSGKGLILSGEGVKFQCKAFGKDMKISSKLVGGYNAENLLGSIIVARMCGVKEEEIEEYVKNIEPAEGRFNIINQDGVNIVVDFAHTPDGLEKVLSVAKEITHGRLMCLFGCGGNRDRLKRPIMGGIAEKYADKIFLTSDNPRFENPREIIAEIEKGIKNAEYEVLEIREEAIARALSCCECGDTLVVAGKGGEKYQDIDGIKIPYDDFEVIKQNLELLGKSIDKGREKNAN